MKQATAVLRRYQMPDATMRQAQRTMHQHFVAHAAALAAFNPEFAAPFGAQWLAALDAADQAPTQTVRAAELRQDTTQVADVLQQARDALQTVFYFVGRAFPRNAGRLTQYGRPDYPAARYSPDKMQTLLEVAFASATRDHLALAAKGYDAAQLAALGTLAPALAAAKTTQGIRKGRNTEASDAYISLQNGAYGYGQQVSAAAAILFAGEAATRALFRLSKRRPARESHRATVRPGQHKLLALATPLLPTTRLRLRLLKPPPGREVAFGRLAAATDAPTPAGLLTAATPSQEVLAGTLGPAGQLVWLHNPGPGPIRVHVTLLPA